MRKYVSTAILIGACCAQAPAQVQVSTTLETYFMTRDGSRGFVHRLSWTEMNVRFNPNVKATLSTMQTLTNYMLDEAYVEGEGGPGSLRVGRIRTAFGLSDWSDLFYNGFNHSPLIRMNRLTDGLRLGRDDAGAEATMIFGPVQAQVAVVDTQVSDGQLLPNEFRHGTLRLQTFTNGAIVGLDVLKSLKSGTNDVYGVDFRWAGHNLIVRGEAMQGSGGQTAWGYYLDAQYRLPHLSRTQAVGRTERLNNSVRGDYSLHTVGIRQVIGQHLSLNLNYGWGKGSNPAFVPASALTGWSLQSMLQFHF